MGPPRNLNELDPKQYPLATLPTPQSLKRFCFDIEGRPTYFREADDPDQAVRDVSLLCLISRMVKSIINRSDMTA